jgi:CHAT domain-containing protein
LGTTAEIKQILEDLRFQFGSLRYGSDIQKRFGTDLIRRTDSLLADLYQTLLLPIAGHLKGNRLIIVPTGLLYYVPFHALNDGTGYVAEKFDTNYAPSAAIWQALHDRKTKKPGTSLLIGYADERIPLVEEEIRQIARVLPGARKLTGDNAGYAAIMNEIGRYELLHIACHGQFRADNPMFSSLHLADGWVTVRDIIAQKLKAKLVTLSACETGLNELFAGDEILGLARGFLAAGAESLIVSLWSVNDEATGRLMAEFYQTLQRGSSIAASLRAAQMGFIERGEHPYFWSPFVLIGR